MPPRSGAVAAAGLLAGLGADPIVPDPVTYHPVAAFGIYAARLERALWRPSRVAGALHTVAAVLPVTLAGAAADRALRTRPSARVLYVALLTWSVVGAASLHREARGVERTLGEKGLPAARQRLSSLCGRDPSTLDEAALRRAVIESVAENTSDAAIGPLVWGALAGPAALVAYRAVNTLDAMVGHRSERYGRFGWAAARLDDVANLLPARVTSFLAVLLAPSVGGAPSAAVAAWRGDARAHPSPNAGPCEAAFAGALGLRLGGPTAYPYGVSPRPWLGDGGDPRSGDVERAVVLSRRVVRVAAVLCAAASVVRWSR